MPAFLCGCHFPFSGSGSAGSYGNSYVPISGGTEKPFPKVAASFLPSPQQCRRVQVHPHPCQHSVLSVFSVIVILVGGEWYVIAPIWSRASAEV